MRRRLVLVVIPAAAVLLFVARSTIGPSVQHSAGRSETAVLSIPTDPGSLDPQLTLIGATRYLNTYAYDTLVNLVGPGKITSGLAQSWKVVSPERVEFTLHPNITCTDGTKMTASVVKQNLDFVGNPANKSPLLGVFMPAHAAVTANDGARTVAVVTKTPNPFMIQGLAQIQLVCSKGLANRSLLQHGADGTGPYALTSMVPGDHYTFTVRKGYTWGPGGASTATKGIPANVTIKVVTNETTAANLLLTGGLNSATIAGPERSRLDKSKSLTSIVSPASPQELFFNENRGHPAADPAIRKALVQALNLDQIGEVVTSGRGVRLSQLALQNFTPCPGDSVTGKVLTYNPSAARPVLSGAAPMKLLYPTDSGPSYVTAAELAQQQLSAAGANVTLDGQTLSTLQETIFGSRNWDILIIGIGVTTPAQFAPLVSGTTPPHGTDFAGIVNPSYDQAVARATRQVGASGCHDWLQAESALFTAGDVAPLAVTTNATYGRKLTFRLGVFGPLPTSLRLTQ
jgi:peptide/nickel transport system substrate-binding protein